MTNSISFARGYIASGEFSNCRVPQHIQNQIVKSYCDINFLKFVLSRAEYWINGSTDCQLWAALREGFKHIVFYSVWQLPERTNIRIKVYEYCIENEITLHFAVERMRLEPNPEAYLEFEILIKTNSIISREIDYTDHFDGLRELM